MAMVTLYTWLPAPPPLLFATGKMPDAGHSALAIDDGAVYISFWPEEDSLIGRITSLWANRETRHPESYARECDPDGPYMQRPADHVDSLPGLDETRISMGWRFLRESGYDLATWNCSNVAQCLLTLATPAAIHARMVADGALEGDDLAGMADAADDLAAALGLLAAARFVACDPLDVRRFALAYLSALKNSSTS